MCGQIPALEMNAIGVYMPSTLDVALSVADVAYRTRLCDEKDGRFRVLGFRVQNLNYIMLSERFLFINIFSFHSGISPLTREGVNTSGMRCSLSRSLFRGSLLKLGVSAFWSTTLS